MPHTLESAKLAIEIRYVDFMAQYYQNQRDEYAQHHAKECEAILKEIFELSALDIQKLRQEAEEAA